MTSLAAQEVMTVPQKVFGTGSAKTAAYSPASKLIVTGNTAGAFLWDATTGVEIRRFPGPVEEVLAVAFSPDGTQVAPPKKGGNPKEITGHLARKGTTT